MTSTNGTRPTHICLVRDRLIWGGGAERVLIEQAHTLVRWGVRCSVIVSEVSDSALELMPAGAEVHVLGGGRYQDLAFLPRLVKLWRLLRGLRPGCVIAHQSLGDYLHWALKGTGIPFFLMRYESGFYMLGDTTKYSYRYRRSFDQVRGSMAAYLEAVPQHWRPSPARRLLNEYIALRDWWAVRGARRVFTLTPRSQWELKQLYGIDAVVWTPGSTLARRRPSRDDVAVRALREQYGARERQPVILSVNRLDMRKRGHVLIEAVRILVARGMSPKLILVGEGEERARLERQVNEAGLDGEVKFAGFVSDDLLAQHYYMCDVAVAIMWGSWALSVVEPLLYDKKVLISDEIPELLCDVPNVFRTVPEAECVAEGIVGALSSPADSSADLVREHLDWDTQMEQLIGHMFPQTAQGEPLDAEIVRSGHRVS